MLDTEPFLQSSLRVVGGYYCPCHFSSSAYPFRDSSCGNASTNCSPRHSFEQEVFVQDTLPSSRCLKKLRRPCAHAVAYAYRAELSLPFVTPISLLTTPAGDFKGVCRLGRLSWLTVVVHTVRTMASTSAHLPADAGSTRPSHPSPNHTVEDHEKLSDVVRPRSPNRSPKSETSSNEEFPRSSCDDLPFDISTILSQPVSSQGTRLFRSGVLTMSMRPYMEHQLSDEIRL